VKVHVVERQDVRDTVQQHRGDVPGVMGGFAGDLVDNHEPFPLGKNTGNIKEQRERGFQQRQICRNLIWRLSPTISI
jgi:hypothetical protein